MINLNEMTIEEVENKKEFVKALGEFAKTWVDKIQNVIIKHIDELYEDKTFCYILKEWKDSKDRVERINKNEFINAYLEGRNVNYSKNIFNYSDTLYLLCVEKYRSEIDLVEGK